jgi:hypothetical protein
MGHKCQVELQLHEWGVRGEVKGRTENIALQPKVFTPATWVRK